MIQAPELIRRLRNSLGLRQAHTAPTLNEGVQPVMVIGDLTREPVGSSSKTYRASFIMIVAGLNVFTAANLLNPLGSGVRLRVLKLELGTNGQAKEFGIGPRIGVAPNGVRAISTNAMDPSIVSTVPVVIPVSSAANLVSQTGAAAIVPNDWGYFTVLNSTLLAIAFDDMTLYPGQSLSAGNRTPGAITDAVFVNMEWREETLTQPSSG